MIRNLAGMQAVVVVDEHMLLDCVQVSAPRLQCLQYLPAIVHAEHACALQQLGMGKLGKDCCLQDRGCGLRWILPHPLPGT